MRPTPKSSGEEDTRFLNRFPGQCPSIFEGIITATGVLQIQCELRRGHPKRDPHVFRSGIHLNGYTRRSPIEWY